MKKAQFILDCHLGRLAKYLRMLGFDCLFFNPISDNELIALALKEDRIILTRDRGLLKNNLVQQGYWLNATEPKSQVKEVIDRFHLKKYFDPFTRCLECNSELVSIERDDIALPVHEAILNRFEKFNHCPVCQKIYWEGSHYRNMQKTIVDFLGE